MFVQIAWLLLFLQIATKKPCSPLFTRIFYDPSPAPQLKVDMIVMFNTLQLCSDSYIHVEYLNSEDEFKCTAELITIDGPIVPYLQHYVHKCQVEIDSASKVSQFTYFIMPTEQDKPNLVQLAQEAMPFRVIVLANTNMLDDQAYSPFAKAFQSLMESRQYELRKKEGNNHYRINGIILNGGFSEFFSGSRGQSFNKIMSMLSQYSHKWPLLINLGSEQMSGDANIALFQQCFVLGGIAGDGSTGMQGFSFARKANIAIIETSSQYYSQNDERGAYFNTTLSKLDSFFANNQQNGNQFSIVLNRFPLFCSNSEDPKSPYNCQKGESKLTALKNQLSSPSAYPPADLFISSFLNNYERDYPYRNNQFMTLQQSRYKRGDFININEGAGGVGLLEPIAKTQKIFTAFRDTGKAGFGILTIKGDGELKSKNMTDIIQKQVAARKIYDSLSHSTMNSGHKDQTSILNDQYLKSEDLSELDLFLLNYKHIILSKDSEMIVEDVFRIVSDPKGTVLRHQLRAQ